MRLSIVKNAGIKPVSFSQWKSQADAFLNKGKNNVPISPDEAIQVFLPIGRTLVGIATIVLVVVGLILGVKYMIAGANEKAQLKQKLLYYVIAIVLVYGAVGIFNIVVSIMQSIVG